MEIRRGKVVATRTRPILIVLGVLVALILVVIVAIPLFLNANALRTRIETTLTGALGRKVVIGKLDVSILSGGLVAHDVTVADDPAFSTQPFIQASGVDIGVELLPLILHRDVQVRSFTLDSPKVVLLRGANGTWNYSSIGSASTHSADQEKQTGSMIPNLTVASVQVKNGQFTVGDGPGVVTTSPTRRSYDQVDLSATDFSLGEELPLHPLRSSPR